MKTVSIMKSLPAIPLIIFLTLLTVSCPPSIDTVISWAGFQWDDNQKIFYSTLDPWQAKFGYFKFYDKASPYAGIIIQCEPVCFTYDARSWKIEFWKGQYGICTGGEIGIYVGKFDVNTGNQFIDHTVNEFNFSDNTDCAMGDDMLAMSFVLKRKNNDGSIGETVFTRQSDKHWWLTGFKPFVFMMPLPGKLERLLNDPQELDALIAILKDTNTLSRGAAFRSLVESYFTDDTGKLNALVGAFNEFMKRPSEVDKLVDQLEEYKIVSNPSNLVMNCTIVLKDEAMLIKFVDALKQKGYTDIRANGRTVDVVFDKPFTPQPPNPWTRKGI